eukprot:gb/GECG01014911.1/.p1 GENE.gb/GECG01014911.1/~~gb/GECG01014911.1/.p1  ORF type:complete len:289 (+),score=34.38 gb/GECG01014911.1/:1-867(+)
MDHTVSPGMYLYQIVQVEYSFLGNTFRVFINGVTGQAFGLAEIPSNKIHHMFKSARKKAKWYIGFGLASQFLPGVNLGLRILLKLLFKPFFFLPAILSVGSYYSFLRLSPIYHQRKSFADWYEEKEAEKKMQAQMSDEWIFRPTGKKGHDFERERQESKHYRNREEEHQRSRQAHYQSSEDKERRRKQEERLNQKQSDKAKSTRTVKPTPVNPNDYYEVLGLKHLGPKASKDDIKVAFRKQMMKYHPDHNQHTGMDLNAASDRTKLILTAYQTLRNDQKRREYDKSYR